MMWQNNSIRFFRKSTRLKRALQRPAVTNRSVRGRDKTVSCAMGCRFLALLCLSAAHSLRWEPRRRLEATSNATCEKGSGVTCHVRDVKGLGPARLYSQCGQDQYVLEHLLGPGASRGRRGHYVEMGARDGVDDSNTKFFEETLSWRGLLVEARPEFQEPLSRNRPHAHVLHGAASDQHGNCTFYDVRKPDGALEPGWSGLTPQNVPNGATREPYTVRCYELTPILRLLKLQRIDYFSLDVEGSELAVLESIDWARVNIGVLGVESYAENDAEIEAMLRSHGLVRVPPPAPLRVVNGHGGGIIGYPPGNAPQPCWPDHFYINTKWPELRRFKSAAVVSSNDS